MCQRICKSKLWTICAGTWTKVISRWIRWARTWKVSRIHCKGLCHAYSCQNSWSLSRYFLSYHCLSFSVFSDLFKKETLEFFSKTLPILKADDTLPKVAKYEDSHISYNSAIFDSKPAKWVVKDRPATIFKQMNVSLYSSKITYYRHRTKRSELNYNPLNQSPSLPDPSPSASSAKMAPPTDQMMDSSSDYIEVPRQGRGGWCADSHGVFCMLFNAFKVGRNLEWNMLEVVREHGNFPTICFWHYFYVRAYVQIWCKGQNYGHSLRQLTCSTICINLGNFLFFLGIRNWLLHFWLRHRPPRWHGRSSRPHQQPPQLPGLPYDAVSLRCGIRHSSLCQELPRSVEIRGADSLRGILHPDGGSGQVLVRNLQHLDWQKLNWTALEVFFPQN